MANAPKRQLTEKEYLDLERSLETKHEYYQGEVYSMSGASRKHNRITLNIARKIDEQFDGRPCEVFVNDMRVKVSSTGLYTYPDVVATCIEPEFADEAVDTLVNPQVIFEVLSKSTEHYDRNVKSSHYKTLPSLKAYILVSQDQPLVERFLPQPDGQWLLWSSQDLDDELVIDCLDCKLKLRDIYARIEFEPPDQNLIREAPAEEYSSRRPSFHQPAV